MVFVDYNYFKAHEGNLGMQIVYQGLHWKSSQSSCTSRLCKITLEIQDTVIGREVEVIDFGFFMDNMLL